MLADNKDHASFNGTIIRKGSIAAFIKNVDLLELDAENPGAMAALKELAPAIVAVGLHKHVTFKNKLVQDLLDREAAIVGDS